MDLADPINVTAIATSVYAGLTLLILLDSRASRHALTDKANVSARVTLSHGGDVEDAVYLENAGPAVATAVDLTVQYLDREGKATGRPGRFAVPLLAPGDRYPLLVSTLLRPEDSREMLPGLEELAVMGLKLKLAWTWRDNRRPLLWILPTTTHHQGVEIDMTEYRSSILGGLLMLEPDLYTELRDLRKELEKDRRESSVRRSWREDPLPPAIRAQIEGERARAQLDLWRARVAVWGRLLARAMRARRSDR
jgi:hypothetical protein